MQFAVNKEPGDQSEPNNTAERAAPVDLTTRRTQVVPAGRVRIDSAENGAAVPDEDGSASRARRTPASLPTSMRPTTNCRCCPTFQLYDSDRKLLRYGEYVWGDERIIFYTLPYRGTYFLRRVGRSHTEGPYRLCLNLLPPDVRFSWCAPPSIASNWFSQVRFTGAGQYVVGSQLYDRLSQFRTDGDGTPEFRLHDSSGLYMLLDAAAEVPKGRRDRQQSRCADEVWTLAAAAGNWARRRTGSTPGGITRGPWPMTSSEIRQVLFGGDHQEWTTCNKTWEWDGNAWTEIPLDSSRARHPGAATAWCTIATAGRASCSAVTAGTIPR